MEDTGRIRAAMATASESEGAVLAIAENLHRLQQQYGGGNGGGGVPPEVHSKQIKRHNWIAVLLAAVLGPGGALGVIYATRDQTKTNSAEIEHNGKQVERLEPRVKASEDGIQFIKNKVKANGATIGEMRTEQTAIHSGIEELKKENVNRLKEELDDAKRELRRRRRPR